jgi:hypothetical protein
MSASAPNVAMTAIRVARTRATRAGSGYGTQRSSSSARAAHDSGAGSNAGSVKRYQSHRLAIRVASQPATIAASRRRKRVDTSVLLGDNAGSTARAKPLRPEHDS